MHYISEVEDGRVGRKKMKKEDLILRELIQKLLVEHIRGRETGVSDISFRMPPELHYCRVGARGSFIG